MTATRRVAIVVLILSTLSALPRAQRGKPAEITVAELDAHLRFLSSDLLEGRAPGTRGEQLTINYLATELQALGVKPGANGRWFDPVKLLVHDQMPNAPVRAAVSGRVDAALAYGKDLTLANETAAGDVSARGELVFVGFGIDAPRYRWDDFAGLDLNGKIAIALRGEPVIPGDTIRFNGPRASRYSWVRDKAREMAKRGAIGVLWVGKQGALAAGPPGRSRSLASELGGSLRFTGSIADSTLARLLPPDQERYPELLASAGRPGFRARPLGLTLSVEFHTAPREVLTQNVLGLIPGTDPALAREHVVLSAHWDAYGIIPPVGGDSIANGALDDGSGVIIVLALARVFAQAPLPRPVLILFTTAEEWGLLGAEAFVRSGAVPMEQIVANLNVDDGMEFYGRRRDVAPLGIELSSLGATVRAVARARGLTVSRDPFPAEGFFLRADNYPFARAGVPALYMALGTDGIGHPKGWVEMKVNEYLKTQYHRPSDEYAVVAVDLEGSKQLADFTRDVAVAVGTSKERPRWLKDSEFGR